MQYALKFLRKVMLKTRKCDRRAEINKLVFYEVEQNINPRIYAIWLWTVSIRVCEGNVWEKIKDYLCSNSKCGILTY